MVGKRWRAKGAALAEYVVLMGMLAVVVIFAVVSIGAQITGGFTDSATVVQERVEDAPSGGTTGGTVVPPSGPVTFAHQAYVGQGYWSFAKLVQYEDPAFPARDWGQATWTYLGTTGDTSVFDVFTVMDLGLEMGNSSCSGTDNPPPVSVVMRGTHPDGSEVALTIEVEDLGGPC